MAEEVVRAYVPDEVRANFPSYVKESAFKYQVNPIFSMKPKLVCDNCGGLRTPYPNKQSDGTRYYCKSCNAAKIRNWRKKNRLRYRNYANGRYATIQSVRNTIRAAEIRRQRELKVEALSRYGKTGKPECINGDCSDIRALSIDHIMKGESPDEEAGEHLTGMKLWRWLKANEWPEGYQTLCMNCQWIKRAEKHEANGPPRKFL